MKLRWVCVGGRVLTSFLDPALLHNVLVTHGGPVSPPPPPVAVTMEVRLMRDRLVFRLSAGAPRLASLASSNSSSCLNSSLPQWQRSTPSSPPPLWMLWAPAVVQPGRKWRQRMEESRLRSVQELIVPTLTPLPASSPPSLTPCTPSSSPLLHAPPVCTTRIRSPRQPTEV